MKKTTIIPVLLVTLLLSAGSAFAWPGGQGMRNCNNPCNRQGQGMGQGMNYEQHQARMTSRLAKMAVILDLTKEQQSKIENLVEKQWQERQSMRAEMQASRGDLRAYRQGTQFNESDFRAKAQKQADLKTEMMVQRAKTRQQLFAVLTPEQQQKAEKLWAMDGGGFFGPQYGNRNCAGQGMRAGKGYGQRWSN